MAYPPELPPSNRTDSTTSATNHASDHNKIAAALRAFIETLGANPAGGYADLTSRLADLAQGVPDTVAALVQAGVPPLVAEAIAADPTIIAAAQAAVDEVATDLTLVRTSDPGAPDPIPTDVAETWAEVLVDQAGNVASGTRKDGSTYIGRLDVGELYGATFEEVDDDPTGLGYVEVTTDSSDRLLEGILPDGTRHIARAKVDELNGSEYVLHPETVGDWLEVTTDEEGRILEGVRVDGTRFIGRLEARSVEAQESGASDVVLAGYELRQTSALGGIACFGDSMTQGVGGGSTSYPGVLSAAVPGISVLNRGISGQTSTEIALRHGGLDVYVTVEGRTIPASGPVNVTVHPAGTYRAGSTWTFLGSLAGVPGTLRKDGAGAWTFTRTTAGTATPVAAEEPFVSDQRTAPMVGVIVWAGRNNVDAAVNLRDVRAVVTRTRRLGAPVLVLPILNAQNEPSGSTGYNNVAAANAQLEAMAGEAYYDSRRWLNTYALEAAGITPTDADVTALAEDRPPPSLMSDNLHLNAAGYTALGNRLATIIRRKGWLT